VDRWRHPYRVRQALAWAQPGGRLPGAFARAKLAYAVAAASCDDLATLWQCEGYEDGFHNALRWLESLDGINREPHTLLPFVVALYSGAYLTSVQVASPAAAPEPAVAAARWMAPPEAPEPTWVNLPVPLLVPPPPGTLGVFYVDVPHSMWVRSMLSTVRGPVNAYMRPMDRGSNQQRGCSSSNAAQAQIKPAVAAMADGRAVFFPASHVGMMRTSAGDVFLAKAVVVERSGQLGPVVHVRIRCSAEPAADRASVRPPPRCEVTRVLQAQFTLSSPIRYFN